MQADFQQRICACLARVGKAFANGHRLALLRHLSQGERSVESLARLTGLTVANTSQHLQHLRNAGLVESRKLGQNVIYRLAEEAAIVQMLDLIEGLAIRRLHEAHLLVSELDMPAGSPSSSQVRRILADAMSGRVRLVDLRRPEEHAAGSLPGACNVPFDELEHRHRELTDGRPLWLFGRGPCCELAALAVRQLRAAGVDAHNLGLGVPQCRNQGLLLDVVADDGSAAA